MDRAKSNEDNTEVLAGLVERVTFHNQDSGFCVLRLKAHGWGWFPNKDQVGGSLDCLGSASAVIGTCVRF